MSQDTEKLIRLEKVVRALMESNSTTEALKKLVSPFDEKDLKFGGTPAFEQLEENIFNEQRLYEALGKEDARTVLGIFERFRTVCELLRRA